MCPESINVFVNHDLYFNGKTLEKLTFLNVRDVSFYTVHSTQYKFILKN